MNAVDLIAILGLAFAAWSLIASKERKFIPLYFAKWQIGILIALWVFSIWLLAFDWIRANWWPELIIFTHYRGIPAKTWALIIMLSTIAFAIGKVLLGFFPKSRSEKVLKVYQALLDQGELQTLTKYVNRYHTTDIERYLKAISKVPSEPTHTLQQYKQTEEYRKNKKIRKKRRMLYAHVVFYGVVKKEKFVERAALGYPDIFLSAIRGMESKNVADEEFVHFFLNMLIEQNSPQLIGELKEMDNHSSNSLNEMQENYALPIMGAVLHKMPIAAHIRVWYPFGERGMNDLQHNPESQAFLSKKYDGSIDHQLWNYRIYLCIAFFNHMVREAIYREVQSHMWLFYYSHFTRAIIENIPVDNDYEDGEFPSFNHRLIYDMVDDIHSWLDLAVKQKTDRRVIDALKCLGKILKDVAEADDRKVGPLFKRYMFDSAIGIYFRHYKEGETADLIKEWIVIVFKDPLGAHGGVNNITSEYRDVLLSAWNKFDRVPYERSEEHLLKGFHQEVINEIQ